MTDAHERRAAVIVATAVLLSVFGGFSVGGTEDWQVVVRMLAGLALFEAILLGVGALVADDLGHRLLPKRSLLLGAAAGVAIAVLLLTILLVTATLDGLGQNDL